MTTPNIKTTLGELVTLRSEKIFANKVGHLPYVGLEHIASGQPRLLGVAESASSVSVNSIFQKDDILFGKLRPNLRKSLRAPFPGYCSTDILVLRCMPGIIPSFAGHVFQWERVFSAATKTAAGTKMPRTSWEDLRELAVFLPDSVAEQSRIAAVLDVVDEAIFQTEAVIAKIKQIRTGLLQDLLTRGLDGNGELRNPDTQPEQFRASALGLIPRDWKVCGVLDLATSDRQCVLTGPFGAQLGQKDWVADGIAVLRIGNVQAGYIDWSDLRHVSREKAIELQRYTVKPGDLLFARQGATTGRNALADERAAGALINYHIIRLAVDPNRCEPVILHGILNSESTSRQVNRDKGRSTREGINTEQICALNFALPPIQEQRAIVAILKEYDGQQAMDSASLAKLRQLKSGLMSDLLTGRVRVPADLLDTRT